MKTIKSILYYLSKKHFFSIAFTILLILFCFIRLSVEINLVDLTIDIFKSVLSGWMTAAGAVLLIVWERSIEKRCEDAEKLTEDYSGLVKKYGKDNLVKYVSGDKEVLFPVVQLGETGDVSVSPTAVVIKDDPKSMYQLPDIIESNFFDIFKAHARSVVYNNRNIRARDICLTQNKLYLDTQRTTYYNSMVTNRAMDWKWNNVTIRELFELGPKLTPLNESLLSNHLGFNGFIESADGMIAFVKRKGNLSIGKSTYGNSIGASLKTKYALNESEEFTVSGLSNAIYGEIRDELKLEQDSIDEVGIRIIAAYRDCVEGGKPQFLFYAKSRLTAKEIDSTFESPKSIRTEHKEYIHSLTSDLKDLSNNRKRYRTLTDGNRLSWVRRSDIQTRNITLLPNLMIADCTVNNRTKTTQMKMVPSASASVALLTQYFDSLDSRP